jgi:DNA-binding IclR family transcriptional regulator
MKLMKQTKSEKKTGLTRTYATPALEKGLDVLELLAREPGGLTKSEIARRLGRSVSEIFRMLLCLESRHYIAQRDDDKYRLTLRMFQLVQEYPPIERLISQATPILHRLAEKILQSCHMAVIEGGRIVIVSQVNAPTSTGFYVKLGSSVDIMEATSGFVILAHQSPDHRERTLAEWKRRSGKEVPKDLQRHLGRLARSGYEMHESYQVSGVVNISFPVLNDQGSAIGAVTVPFIRHVLSKQTAQDVLPELKAAAQEITQTLGGRIA